MNNIILMLNIKKSLLATIAIMAVSLSISPIAVSHSYAATPHFVTDTVTEKVFSTELSTIVKNAQMISLMEGEKQTSSQTILSAAKESGYADSVTKAESWGAKGSVSKGKNGSVNVKKKNLYLFEKKQASLTSTITCQGLVKAGKTKLTIKKISCTT